MHINKTILSISLAMGFSFALILGFLPLIFNNNPTPPLQATDQISIPNPTLTPTPTSIPNINTLSLDTIMNDSYQNNRVKLSHLPQNEVIQIVAGGDVMLGREVGVNITRLQDFTYPFQLVAPVFQTADIAMVNLENPVIDNCPLTSEGMTFCSSPGTLLGLEYASIDVVNLANNHTLNYGNQGLDQTLKYLSQSQIRYTGLDNQTTILEIRGVKVAILGFSAFSNNDRLSQLDRENIQSSLSQVSKISDLQIVNFHWGSEYQPQPSVSQRLLAYTAIDAGADVIIGHHSHWVQGVEVYKEKPIFYSLGNLIFDQMWSTSTREGLIVELNFFRNQVAGIYLKPTFIQNIAQPNLIPAGRGNSTLGKIENLSKSLQDSQSQMLQLYQP